MPRPSNRLARRQQILQAFMSVVARRGYAGATTPQVASAAGLAPGLIHYHFQSKQELLLELLRHLRDLIRERVRRRADPRDKPLRQLEAFIDAHLARERDADRLAVACWQVLGAEALHEPSVGRAYRRVVRGQLRELESILGRWPGVSRVRARRIAAAILAGVQGYFHLAATNPRAIPPGSAAACLRQMARGLLRARTP